MIKIVQSRGSGKTTKLIKISNRTKQYILVADRERAKQCYHQAIELGLDIPYPIHIDEYLKLDNVRGNRGIEKGVLVDDLEDVMQNILSNNMAGFSIASDYKG